MTGQQFIDTLGPLLAGAEFDSATPSEELEETVVALNRVAHELQHEEFKSETQLRERVQTLLDKCLIELKRRHPYGLDGMTPLTP